MRTYSGNLIYIVFFFASWQIEIKKQNQHITNKVANGSSIVRKKGLTICRFQTLQWLQILTRLSSYRDDQFD
jgi:hypothetical protein